MKLLATFLAGVLVAGVLAFGLYFAPLGASGVIPVPEYEPTEFADGYTPPEHRNAAIAYGRYAMNIGLLQERIADLPLGELFDRGDGYDAGQLEAIRWAAKFNEDWREASMVQRCDWQPPLELGGNAVLPHLSFLRIVFKLLVLEGDLRCIEQDHHEGLRSYAAALRVARHVGQGESLVEANMSSRLVITVTDRVRQKVDLAAVEGELQAEWLEAIGRFEDPDPYGFLAGIETAVEWTARVTGLELVRSEKFSGGRGSGRIVPDRPIVPRSASDAAVVSELMKNARAWKRDMLDAWRLTGGERIEAVKVVDRRLGAGAFGSNTEGVLFPLAKMAEQAADADRALAEASRSAGIAP